MQDSTRTPFGKEMREKHFLFNKNLINLNNGSFGSYPRSVRDALRYWQDEAESCPDEFIRYIFPEKLRNIRRQIASLLNADVDSTVLVPNATTGLNTVLRNIQFQPGDKIAYFKGIYGAIGRTVDYLIETTPVEAVEIDFDPVKDTEDDLVSRFTGAIKHHGGSIKVAIFDTVMCMPGLLMPFERLTQVCRQEGVLSLIDGAHGIGFIKLDLKELDPDFLVTNCHKWLMIPRACAVFYVAARNQHLMRSSLPTSHGFVALPDASGGNVHFNPVPSSSANAFVAQFEYTGTIDSGSILCIPQALEFRNNVCGGEDHIRDYCTNLAAEGEILVAAVLGTDALAVSPERRVGFANVRLPLKIGPGGIPKEHLGAVINFMFRKFSEDYKTFMNLLYFSDTIWVRISATVYLDITDFDYGATVLKELCQRVEAGEYLAMLS